MRKKIFVTLLAAIMTLALPAVSYAEDAAKETVAMDIKTIGEKTEDCYEILVKNKTGRPITAVAVKDADAKEFGDNLLKEKDVWKAEEERTLYCVKDLKDEKAEKDDKLTYPNIDLQISFTEEESYVIHSFPFEDLKDGRADISALDGVAFIVYNSISEKKEVNTKETELDLKKEKEPGVVKEEPQYSADNSSYSYDDDYDYSDYSEDDYSYDYSYEEPVYDEPSYSEPTGEGCIEDGLTW